MKLFGEITKVEPQDDGALKVTGVASTGAVDEADERVLPQAMKAALPAYMRFGALREMHGLTAAGATLTAEVGEDGATRIEALVVDPVAVRKVQLGVYKGFSIGGKVLERDPADRRVITKLKLNEISLVDRPCNPEAVIDMWKADGAMVPAGPSNAEVIARAADLARAADKPGRHADFVLKARQALLAEMNDSSKPAANDNADLAADAAAPIGEGADDDETTTATSATEDLAHIQAAHDHLVELGACCQCDSEDQQDGDDDAEDKALHTEDLAKVLADNARLSEVVGAMAPHIDELRRTIETLERRLGDLAAQPAPPKAMAGFARAVSKAEDANPHDGRVDPEALAKYFDSLSPEERGRLQLKAALRQPIIIGR
jgi:hypothetical protein